MNQLDSITESRHSIINMDPLDRWASVLLGAGIAGSAFRRPNAALRTIVGVELLRRGITGHCYAYQAFGFRTRAVDHGSSVSVPYELGVRARASITISKPRAAVYGFWRDFENLPRIMKHLISVTVLSDTRSHWVAEGPGGKHLQWDAEIHNDVENERIAWRSLPGADVDSTGSVQFRDATGGRGTEVVVHMQYNPPAGFVGATVAKLFGRDAETEIESDLFRLKQYLESGEVATTNGQPQGAATSRRASRRRSNPAPANSRQEVHA